MGHPFLLSPSLARFLFLRPPPLAPDFERAVEVIDDSSIGAISSCTGALYAREQTLFVTCPCQVRSISSSFGQSHAHERQHFLATVLCTRRLHFCQFQQSIAALPPSTNACYEDPYEVQTPSAPGVLFGRRVPVSFKATATHLSIRSSSTCDQACDDPTEEGFA